MQRHKEAEGESEGVNDSQGPEEYACVISTNGKGEELSRGEERRGEERRGTADSLTSGDLRAGAVGPSCLVEGCLSNHTPPRHTQRLRGPVVMADIGK